MITTIQITDADLQLKKEIEASYDGAKISHTAIYRRGLVSFREIMDRKKNSIDTQK